MNRSEQIELRVLRLAQDKGMTVNQFLSKLEAPPDSAGDEPTEEMVEWGREVLKEHKAKELLFEYAEGCFRQYSDRELVAEIYRRMHRAALAPHTED